MKTMEKLGSVSAVGGLALRPIRVSDLPGSAPWRGLSKAHASKVERAFLELHRTFTTLSSVEDHWEEAARLEELLGIEPMLRVRREDEAKVLRQYVKILSARMLGRLAGLPVLHSALRLASVRGGVYEDLGLVSLHVVTTAGVNFIVDAFQNIVELEILKFHGVGTGSVAEAVGDTALGTELTTQYNPDNTRATGSLTEGAANVFRTVGTNLFDAAVAITEHGILSQAATGGGTLLDRSVFSVVNLGSGDSLQSTYDLTVSAGG